MNGIQGNSPAKYTESVELYDIVFTSTDKVGRWNYLLIIRLLFDSSIGRRTGWSQWSRLVM